MTWPEADCEMSSTGRPLEGGTSPLGLGARIRSDCNTVVSLIATVELWPALFPSIRYARVLDHGRLTRRVVVRASWRGLPVSWRATQTIDPGRGLVSFHHVDPIGRGTTAIWTVAEADDGIGVDVSVQMVVAMGLPLVGRPVARHLLGRYVFPELGRQMLSRLKEIAEGGSLAGPG
jgi:hypothetical protein